MISKDEPKQDGLDLDEQASLNWLPEFERVFLSHWREHPDHYSGLGWPLTPQQIGALVAALKAEREQRDGYRDVLAWAHDAVWELSGLPHKPEEKTLDAWLTEQTGGKYEGFTKALDDALKGYPTNELQQLRAALIAERKHHDEHTQWDQVYNKTIADLRNDLARVEAERDQHIEEAQLSWERWESNVRLQARIAELEAKEAEFDQAIYEIGMAVTRRDEVEAENERLQARIAELEGIIEQMEARDFRS